MNATESTEALAAVDADVRAFLDRAVTAAARAVREAVVERLATYERQAADADEPLEYRRGVGDAAAVAAEYLGRLERGAS